MKKVVSLGNLMAKRSNLTDQALLENEAHDDLDALPSSISGSFRMPRRPSTEQVAEMEEWNVRADESRLVSKCGNHWQVHARTRKRRRKGKSTVLHSNKALQYIWRDPFTSLIDAKWHRVLLFGCFLYIFMWFLFALLYYIFNNEKVPGCHSSDITSFADAFLLSVDSQSTIGFGNYSVSSDCMPGVVVLVVQLLCSILIDAAFVGLVFAKISRPQNRAESVVFSSVACVTEVKGARYLSMRVADQRKQQLCEAHARLLMFSSKDGDAGDDSRSCMSREGFEPVEVEVETLRLESKEVFLLMPWIIRHRIDETSPLWQRTLQDLEDQRAEFILILEGSTASTGQTTQAKQSYLPCEILLGHEFESCCGVDEKGRYEIDFERINNTRPQRPTVASLQHTARRVTSELGAAGAAGGGGGEGYQPPSLAESSPLSAGTPLRLRRGLSLPRPNSGLGGQGQELLSGGGGDEISGGGSEGRVSSHGGVMQSRSSLEDLRREDSFGSAAAAGASRVVRGDAVRLQDPPLPREV